MKKLIGFAFTACLVLVFTSGAQAQTPASTSTTVKRVEQKEAPKTVVPAGTVTPAAAATTPATKVPEGEAPKQSTTKVRTRAISIDEDGVEEENQPRTKATGTPQRVAAPKKVKTVPK